MTKIKFITFIMLSLMVFAIVIPVQVSHAAPANSVLNALTASTMSSTDDGGSSGSNIFEKLFGFLFDKILGPILNIFDSKSTPGVTADTPVKVTPLPAAPSTGTGQTSGSLRGKVIVVDPGHGGSNPGAVANNTRESDNNLAVGLKLRDQLVQAGAKVIMTRETDRTVAAAGSSLGQELQARVNLAEANNADIFVSIHSNSNPDSKITGAMTFYHSNNSSNLASNVQTAIIEETGAVNKGTSTATFYVIRNTSMPSILVEMGFISNAQEAARLNSDAYRNRLATGIFNGIAKSLNSR
ncbi:N-acetylmuramoyl-L-alanine amidase|uniref:N-acetylmuramoyl-L-alanine amidase n=1 Tax=Dendrosporobacter quercicolus TaxID=146817 RepID=A0A1G9LMA8_9FIRM|nr:N-acetylmuramoyl-L-alanine amidase [Dendrosporobacter quercicolus]NSL46759.1 N-acetylmuramoyl-L-alanine amidase [Dendrosporobacter quercicolus DSM 1736]SDL62983.1 N-acetylmuramoyl-L-alanine amidase [Dendrosporobacter quercicolus]